LLHILKAVAQKQAHETVLVLALAEDWSAGGLPLKHELLGALKLVEELLERLERKRELGRKTEADHQCRHC